MGEPNTSSPAFDNYILNRDFTASVRLNCQHYIWLQELGYNLHPSIPISSHCKTPRIADVATGTGAWLLEVARTYPHATCDGFDVSLAQTPPAVWLPTNVSFSEWNMFDPPPAHLLGTYDIVHIRLVTLVIQNKDPAGTIQNDVRLGAQAYSVNAMANSVGLLEIFASANSLETKLIGVQQK